jgi:hypothetical protein
VPAEYAGEREETADCVLVNERQIGHGGQTLRDYPTKVDRCKQEEAGDLAAELGRCD